MFAGHGLRDRSFLEELEAQDYDLKTLKFSIERKEYDPPE